MSVMKAPANGLASSEYPYCLAISAIQEPVLVRVRTEISNDL